MIFFFHEHSMSFMEETVLSEGWVCFVNFGPFFAGVYNFQSLTYTGKKKAELNC